MGKKLAICVPYRNRETHMNEFVPYMSEFLTNQGIEHKIFIAHQADDKLFNRGKMKNIAFDIARKEGYDYFCFHDIDMLPENDSADYSYCEEAPVHLSYYLSDYGYKLPYLENFGGALMFTKEQFEQVNGYYNDYWDWGAEDDDLFWRCRRNDYLDIVTHATQMTKPVAKFDGKTSSIEIPYCESLEDAISGNYSISMLVRTPNRTDVAPYLRGDDSSEYLAVPLLSKGAFDHIVWVNTNVMMGYAWNSKNEPASAWLTNSHDVWQHLIVTVDNDKEELRFFINGFEAVESRISFKDGVRKYYSEPFIVGTSDSPSWDMGTHSWFKGEIADIAFWNRALSDADISSIYTTAELNLPQDGLAYHLDFSKVSGEFVEDVSGNGEPALLKNVEIVVDEICNLQTAAKPHRRRGRYRNLPHQTEGIQAGKYVKGGTSALNEKILVEEVMTGKLDTSENGLSNLEYREIERRVIFDNHVMVDVEA